MAQKGAVGNKGVVAQAGQEVDWRQRLVSWAVKPVVCVCKRLPGRPQ